MRTSRSNGLLKMITSFCNDETRLKAAKLAFKTGHIHRARALFQKALAQGRHSPRIYLLRRGENLHQSGKKEEALAMFRQGVESFPLDQECCRAYVELLREQGRLSEAAPVFEKNIRKYPDHPMPRNFQAILAYLEGNLSVAKQIWEEIVQRWPKFAAAVGNLAAVHIQEGLFNQALVELEAAVKLEPAYAPMVFNNMAEICILRGDYHQAQQYLLSIVSAKPDNKTALVNLGHCYYALNELGKAIQAYERALTSQAIELCTEDSRGEVIPNLVKLYLRNGRSQEALQLAEQHLKEYPQDTRLMLALGQYHFKQGNFQGAAEILREALTKVAAGPGLHLTHRYLALAYYKLGQLDKAMQQYAMANSYGIDSILPGFMTQKFTGDVSADINRQWSMATQHTKEAASCRKAAMAYVELGALDEAKEHFRQALGQEQENAESYTCLGFLELATDEYFPALWNFGRAVEINPRYVPAHVGMGMAYLWRGRTDAAIVKCKWALAMESENAAAHHYLGVAYERKGLTTEAAEEYQRAADADPNYVSPRYCLARLKKKTDPGQTEMVLNQVLRICPGYAPAIHELMTLMQEQGRNLEAEVLKVQLRGSAETAGLRGVE